MFASDILFTFVFLCDIFMVENGGGKVYAIDINNSQLA